MAVIQSRCLTLGKQSTIYICGLLLVVASFLAYSEVAKENFDLRNKLQGSSSSTVARIPPQAYPIGGGNRVGIGIIGLGDKIGTDWFATEGARDAEIRWSELDDRFNATAELTVWVEPLNPNEDVPPAAQGSVRIMNVTDGIVVTDDHVPVMISDSPKKIALKIPQELKDKTYRLQLRIFGSNVAMRAQGDLVVRQN